MGIIARYLLRMGLADCADWHVRQQMAKKYTHFDCLVKFSSHYSASSSSRKAYSMNKLDQTVLVLPTQQISSNEKLPCQKFMHIDLV